jgi:selenocysteine lyase/cysteine desulfurase
MITIRISAKPLSEVMSALAEDDIHVRPVGEAGLNGVRVSFHIYNDENDLDKAIESIKKIVAN